VPPPARCFCNDRPQRTGQWSAPTMRNWDAVPPAGFGAKQGCQAAASGVVRVLERRQHGTPPLAVLPLPHRDAEAAVASALDEHQPRERLQTARFDEIQPRRARAVFAGRSPPRQRPERAVAIVVNLNAPNACSPRRLDGRLGRLRREGAASVSWPPWRRGCSLARFIRARSGEDVHDGGVSWAWHLRPIAEADRDWAFALHRESRGDYVIQN
jgi:hypothetical protein